MKMNNVCIKNWKSRFSLQLSNFFCWLQGSDLGGYTDSFQALNMVAWLRNDFFKVLSKLSEFCSHPVTHVSHFVNQAIAWHPIIRAAYFLRHIKEHRILCQGSKYQSFIARHCLAMNFSFWGVKIVRILFTLFLEIPLIFLGNAGMEKLWTEHTLLEGFDR